MTDTAKELQVVQKEEELLFELRLWINKIKFSKAILDNLQRYLEKLVRHYPDPELMSEVERYQNKIIVYRDVADKMVKDFKVIRNAFQEAEMALKDQLDFHLRIAEEKDKLIHRAFSFIKILEELKENFIVFYTGNYVSENHITNR